MKPKTEKRLFLLDSYALIFRGYYAFIKNPRINSKGLNTSAIMGFTSFLLDLMAKEQPTHMAAVFDVGASSIRKKQYPKYKANREKTPEAIVTALPYIHDILKAFHIPILYAQGYEADDVIGTLAQKAQQNAYLTYMVTLDKDFGQLVTDKIKIYKPAAKGNTVEILGVQEVCLRHEVQDPRQVIDILGMMGDAVDNIPGLPGVGEKTAKKFVQLYGSLENLFLHSHQLKGKIKERIEENKQLGLISKQLATIITDVPIEWDEQKLLVEAPDANEVQRIFEKLEFKRLLEQFHRLFSKAYEPRSSEGSFPAAQQTLVFDDAPQEQLHSVKISGFANIDTTDHLYQLIDTQTACKMLLKELLKQKTVAFKTHTTRWNALDSTLLGIAFSYEKGTGYYVDFPEDFDQVLVVVHLFKPFFEDERILKVGHHLKYDLKVLYQYGLFFKGPFYDTMIAHYLLRPDASHQIEALSENFLSYKPLSIERFIGKKGKNQLSMCALERSLRTQYASEQADLIFQLKEIFDSELIRYQAEMLFYQVEMPLIPVLAAMEIEGIALDPSALKVLSEELEKDLSALERKIYQDAGGDFNVNSPKQLGEILFEKLKIVRQPKKTKTGQYATSEEVLTKLIHEHIIIKNILKHRELQKLKSTYVDALFGQIDKQTHRVHTIFGQTTTVTGRLSSTDPNLQNIPIRSARGRKVRKAFVARDEDHLILSADYSQIELRIIAELSQDPQMREAFIKGEDIHASTASKVFNIPLEELTREQRNRAKTVNFGIIYGVSAFGLSEQTDLSRSEAKKLIDAYYDTYSTLKAYMSDQIARARDCGFVETIMGRRRYLPDINSANSIVRAHAERNAINAPIQGSAADIIKLAMVRIDKSFKERALQSKMLLQVHDELVFDVPKSEIDLVSQLVVKQMQTAVKTQIPLMVEVGRGRNWLEAH